MKIAIASGKGGTGKTTIATNLALYLSGKSDKVVYLDCDVEEPNGHLFLTPSINQIVAATISIPIIDESKCIACGECVNLCQFNALIRLGKMVMVYPELCHGCGGCSLLCSQQAISELNRDIGVVEVGYSDSIHFLQGRLNVGETMSPPLIRKLLQQVHGNTITIIDAPPGTSCPVISSISSADFIVLVTESTPFGLNDLGLALDMVNELNIPYGVVVNRYEQDNIDAEKFCRERQVDIIARISDKRLIAEAYSRGEMALIVVPSLQDDFQELWNSIRKRVFI